MTSPVSPPIALLDDAHAGSAEDVFGHRSYAKTLALAINAAPTGATFGLLGEWGIGKSTVLHSLREELGPDVPVVIFDAWRYEADAFRREFLRDSVEQLVKQASLRRFSVDRDLADLDLDIATASEFFDLSWRHWLQTVWPIAIGVLAGYLIWKHSGLTSGRTLTSAGAVAATTYVTNGVARALRTTSRTATRKRLEDSDRFSRRFRNLLGAVTKERLVIAIDNVDRLDAASAVAVLSTVKSYLEPAAVTRPRSRYPFRQAPNGVHVNFVIAADERALVAHLDAVSEQGSHRPDEFLRKFFAVRLTMRALLDDDLQTFVSGQIEPLVARWATAFNSSVPDIVDAEWSAEQVAALTDIAAAGLRANPRRLKQFVNSLEMTLLLLWVRFREGHLPEPIANLALVGQLVLIEEEFPDAFAAVLNHEGYLEDLHLGAQSLSATRASEREWPRLAPVLRSSFSVDRSQARSILRLKLTETEKALPYEQELRAALQAGDVTEIDRRLIRVDSNESRDNASRWAAHIPELIRRHVVAKRHDLVNNHLRCLFESEAFRNEPEAASLGLQRATIDPEIRAGLWRLPPKPLLAAADRFGPADKQRVFDALCRAYALADIPKERQRALASELARRATLISEPSAEQIRSAIGSEPRLSQFDYTPLVVGLPGLAPPQLLEALVESLRRASPPRQISSGSEPSDIRGRNAQTEARAVQTAGDWLLSDAPIVLAACAKAVEIDSTAGRALADASDRARRDPSATKSALHCIAALANADAIADDESLSRMRSSITQNRDGAPLGDKLHALSALTRSGGDEISPAVRGFLSHFETAQLIEALPAIRTGLSETLRSHLDRDLLRRSEGGDTQAEHLRVSLERI